MNKERLLKLADFLRTVPEKGFNLNDWTNVRTVDREGKRTHAADKSTKEIFEGIYNGVPEFNCGTTGCAMGWCPVAFPDVFVYRHNTVCYKGTESYADTDGMDFFGITYGEFTYFFMPHSYDRDSNTTPNEVADRIVACVNNGFPSEVDASDDVDIPF